MSIVTDVKKLHFQRIDSPIKLNIGLRKVLGTKAVKMSRLETMDRLIEKLHFLRLHNILTDKNYRIPPSWQKALNFQADFADEADLLEIIANNSN